jgi:signal transduction histidine kinase
MQACDSQELVQRAVEQSKPAFESQQVSLETYIPADLPAVHADPTRIGHVLGNLLNNALRHSSSGGQVTVRVGAAEGWVEFSVTDDGDGIPRQYLHRIFEKFFRAPGQQGSSGSGLGLSIARDIVQAHGGQIRVESAEGRGTTFAFTLRPVDGSGLHHQATEVRGSQELLNVAGPDDGPASAYAPGGAHASAGVGN